MFAKLSRKLKLQGGGSSVRSFVHIRDVADGTLRVARQAVPPNVYHLSTNRYIAIRDLVAMICKKVGVAFEDMVETADDRPGKDHAYFLDSTKARETLGWSDGIDLESGIGDTIGWVAANFDVLRNQPLNYVHKP